MQFQNLPGIKSIAFLSAAETVIYPKQIPQPGSTISVLGDFTKLPTVELSACVVSVERTDAGLIYTTKVNGLLTDGDVLSSSQRHLLQEKYHSYQLTDVHKNKYLVGTDKKPYPEIVFAPTIDGIASGTRAVPFTIDWKSSLPPLNLVAL